MSARASGRLQRRQINGAAKAMRHALPVTAGQQPRDCRGIRYELVPVCGIRRHTIGRSISRHVKSHHIPLRGEGHTERRPTLSGTRRSGQRHAHGMLQRRRIGTHRLHIVSQYHGTGDVAVGRMVRKQLPRRPYAITRHERLQRGIRPPWQLSQLAKQTLQPLGVNAQSRQEHFVGNTG